MRYTKQAGGSRRVKRLEAKAGRKEAKFAKKIGRAKSGKRVSEGSFARTAKQARTARSKANALKDKMQSGGKRNPAFFQTLPSETPKQMKERLEQEKIDKMYPDGELPYDDDGPYGEEPKNKKSKTMKKKQMGGLKTPTSKQKGLKKLPKPVRNKMGYKKMGGDYMEPSKEIKFGGPTKKQTGGTTNYPVYKKDSEQAKSFRKAYAAAEPGSVFTWEGRKYKKEGKAAPKPAAGKPAKTVDTSGSSTIDKIAKGDTSGATKVEASAKEGSKKRDARRSGRKAARATRKADRRSGATKVARMEKRNVKKVGRIQDRQTSKARRADARTERQAPRKARKAAIKGAKAQMKANIRAAKGKPDKKFLGGLAGAIGGLKATKGQGLGARLKGMVGGAAGGSMLGRGIGAIKGAMGGGGLQGAMQGAAGGAFGNSNPMAQQEEMQQARNGGMRDRRKAKRQGKRDERQAKRRARKAQRTFNKRIKNKKVY